MTFDEFVSEIKNCEYFEDVFSTGNIDLYLDYVKGKYDDFDIVDAMRDYCNTCERPSEFIDDLCYCVMFNKEFINETLDSFLMIVLDEAKNA